jgi:hypothetical protein
MSSHMSFYVGAFVEFPELELMQKVSVNRCSNTQCVNHNNFKELSNFCPKCGQAIEVHNYSYWTEKRLDLEDLNQVEGNTIDWHDVLSSNNDLNVYTSNKKGHTGTWYWYDSDQGVQVISADDIEKMKATFTEQLTKVGFFEFVQKHFEFFPEVKFGSFTSWD